MPAQPAFNYYAELGVDASASTDEIKSAYRRLALQHHPDKNQRNRDEATAKFQRLNEAAQALMDPAKRREYNAGGRHFWPPQPAAPTRSAPPFWHRAWKFSGPCEYRDPGDGWDDWDDDQGGDDTFEYQFQPFPPPLYYAVLAKLHVDGKTALATRLRDAIDRGKSNAGARREAEELVAEARVAARPSRSAKTGAARPGRQPN